MDLGLAALGTKMDLGLASPGTRGHAENNLPAADRHPFKQITYINNKFYTVYFRNYSFVQGKYALCRKVIFALWF